MMMRDRGSKEKRGMKGRKRKEREKDRGDGVLLAGGDQMKWIGGQLNRKALLE